MSEFLETLGSFAVVWLALWFSCAAVLTLLYSSFRQRILEWHPAIASKLLLLLLAFPFLLGFSSTLLLFTPGIGSIVSIHCHADCGAHMPLIASPVLVVLGLVSILLLTGFTIFRLWFNLHTSKRLRNQLEKLAQPQEEYYLLDNEQPVVFTVGWWRSQIYVTSGLVAQCSEQDVKVILAHEHAHSQRLDNMRLLAASLFTLVLPRQLARQLLSDLHLFIESACDFAAASRFGDLNVAETLLKVQQLSPTQWQTGSKLVLSAFTGAEVEKRIKALIDGRSASLMQYSCLQLSLLFLVLASVGLVEPLHHSIEVLLGMH